MMKYSINSSEELNKILDNNSFVLLYFSSKTCGVCNTLKPKIFDKIEENFEKFAICEVKIEENLELCSSYMVFQAPTILLFIDKQEFKRESRNISVPKFIEDIKRVYEIYEGRV